jgi:hypothetical protein
MATAKLFQISLDERFPDFDVFPAEDQLARSGVRETFMTEQEYVYAIRVMEDYNELQQKLGGLYAKAKKPNS